MQKFDWLVVGGGFQGIISSALLAKHSKNIAIMDRGAGLGGVLRGIEHNELILDLGCHVFNNDKSEVTGIMLEILDGKYHPISIEYAAVTEGHKKEELAVPDFSYWPKEKNISAFYEILKNGIERQDGNNSFDNLQDWMNSAFGADAGAIVGTIMEKASNYKASSLDQSAVYRTPLGCIHLGGDENVTAKIKQQFSEINKVLALPSQKDEMRFYRDAEKEFSHRTFYPSEHGMRGFGEAAEKHLTNKGVDFLLGKTIKSITNSPDGSLIIESDDGQKFIANNLIWTLDVGLLSNILFGENPLKDHALTVPMTLIYYFVDQEQKPAYDYIHDFRSDTFGYRISAPGFYGNQVNSKGQSYYCVEIPSKMDSEIWKNTSHYYDIVWQQMKDIGMINFEKYQDVTHLNSPVSYPMMRSGYRPFYDEIDDNVRKEFPNIINVNMNAYTKNEMVETIKSKMNTLDILK